MSSRTAPVHRSRLRMIAVVVLAAVLATSCVGRLGRNDDDVQPDSHHPSANQAIRVEVPSDHSLDPAGR